MFPETFTLPSGALKIGKSEEKKIRVDNKKRGDPIFIEGEK